MRKVSWWTAMVLAAALAACGGGSDDPATDTGGTGTGGGGGGSAALSCNFAGYTAGAVSVATSADLAAYGGTFNGEEGDYDMAGNFTKSGDAQLVIGSSGAVSYKGASLTATSYCVDNVAGPFGKLLYVEAGDAHFDVSAVDAGDGLRWAWGVAPGGKVFRNGVKQ